MNSTSKKQILIAMTSSLSMVFFNQTLVSVILPAIQKDLSASDRALNWIVNAYFLALAVFTLPGGRLGDILGHRRIFLVGMSIFALASALCALSLSSSTLIVGRACQGLGAAFLLPSTAAILINTFALESRGKAIGIYVSVSSAFLGIGQLVGGFFSAYANARYAFLLNIPIAIFGIALVIRNVPSSRKRCDDFHVKPARPIVDFALFRNPVFLGANICVFSGQFLAMLSIYWSLFMQNVMGLGPVSTGLLSMLATTPILVVAHVAGYLTDRYGSKVPVVIGFSILLAALTLLVAVIDRESVFSIAPALLLFGTGIAFIFAPCSVAALSEVAPDKRGMASAMMMFLRQFGSALGVTTFGAIYLQCHNEREYVDAFIAINSCGLLVGLIGLIGGLKFLQTKGSDPRFSTNN